MTAAVNNTTSAPITADLDIPETPQIRVNDAILSSLAILLSLFICFGNTMTVLAVWTTPALRTLANTYVASLAIADLMVGLELIQVSLYLLPPLRVNIFNRYINLCVLMQGINIGMASASAVHMAFISVDRFLYIAKPYFYQRCINIRVVALCIVFSWIVGLTFAITPQFVHRRGIALCDITTLLPIEYLFYSTYGLYWTLVMVIFIMYGRILLIAYKQHKAIQAMTNIGNDQKDNIAKSKRRRIMKSIRFFLPVFCVFFICLTPMIVCMGIDFYTNVPANLYRFFNLLALANSGMNFVIYGILNDDFRQAYFRMTGLRSCTRSRVSNVQMSALPNLSHTTAS